MSNEYQPTEQDQHEFTSYIEETEHRQIREAEATPPAQRTRQQWAALGWEFGPPIGFDQ
jgi:hypothetical protein